MVSNKSGRFSKPPISQDDVNDFHSGADSAVRRRHGDFNTVSQERKFSDRPSGPVQGVRSVCRSLSQKRLENQRSDQFFGLRPGRSQFGRMFRLRNLFLYLPRTGRCQRLSQKTRRTGSQTGSAGGINQHFVLSSKQPAAASSKKQAVAPSEPNF